MSFVGDLIDANMQKEMSEEVQAFEANVCGHTWRRDEM